MNDPVPLERKKDRINVHLLTQYPIGYTRKYATEYSKIRDQVPLIDESRASIDISDKEKVTRANEGPCESKDHDAMIEKNRHLYQFIWETQSLGVSLKLDPRTCIPYVHRLTGSGSPLIRRIEIGDQLLAVHDIHLQQQHTMKNIIHILQNVSKPAVLTFRAMHTLCFHRALVPEIVETGRPEKQYEVVWKRGSLGLTFDKISQANPLPCVKKNHPQKRTVDSIQSNNAIEIGDILVGVNHRRCEDMKTIDAIMLYINDLVKPIVLRFERRPLVSPCPVMNVKLKQPDVPQMGDHRTDMEEKSLQREKATQNEQHKQESSKYVRCHSMSEHERGKINLQNTYMLQWTDGPLGMTLKERYSTMGYIPQVARLTGHATCAVLHRVAVGDFLLQIGPYKTFEVGFDRSKQLLKTMPKPIELTFQANDDRDDITCRSVRSISVA